MTRRHVENRLGSNVASFSKLASLTHTHAHTLTLTWVDGHSSTFHARWLWYNSDIHKEPDSGQRSLEPWALERAPGIASASVTAAGIAVEWTDGRVSEFTLDWLAANDYSDSALLAAHRRATPGTLVSKGEPEPSQATTGQPPSPYLHAPVRKADVPTFHYDDIMASEKSVWEWLRALNEYGLTIVKGAPTEDKTVLRVASRVAYPMWTIYGDAWDVALMPNPINIAYAPVMLDLHVDLVYYESPPGLQMLHCRQFDDDVVGGQSTFMDGFFAAEELRRRDPDAFATLLRVPATFQKVHYKRERPAHIVAQRPHIVMDRSAAPLYKRAAEQGLHVEAATGQPVREDVAGDITGIFWAPPFEGPLRVPAEDVEPYYDAYTKFSQLLRDIEQDGRHMIEYRMEPGDVSVFNNRRMLHGRRHFSLRPGGSPDAKRVLQGCYVNIDEYKSRLMHLCSVHGGAEHVRRVANQSWF